MYLLLFQHFFLLTLNRLPTASLRCLFIYFSRWFVYPVPFAQINDLILPVTKMNLFCGRSIVVMTCWSSMVYFMTCLKHECNWTDMSHGFWDPTHWGRGWRPATKIPKLGLHRAAWSLTRSCVVTSRATVDMLSMIFVHFVHLYCDLRHIWLLIT